MSASRSRLIGGPEGPEPPFASARLPTQADQAERFGRARTASAHARFEDYVELIGDLSAATGRARPTDIARRLGVSHATVNNCIAKMEQEGLVSSRPYRGATLTAAGEALAARMRSRHRAVVEVLIAIGAPPEVAESDAEGLEHHVSDAALDAFVRFLKR